MIFTRFAVLGAFTVLLCVGPAAAKSHSSSDDAGLLLIGETENSQISAVDPSTGELFGEFIPYKNEPVVLESPDDIVFDKKRNIYISSHNCPSEGRILKFNKHGKFLGRFDSGYSGLRRPYGIAFGPDGLMYVASFRSDEVVRFNAKTGAFVDIFRADLSATGVSGGFNGPDDLAFDGDDLYITTQGSVAADDCSLSYNAPSEILKINIVSGAVAVIDTNVDASEVPSLGFISFLGLKIYDGILYASDFGGGIRRYSLATGARVGSTIDTCFDGATGGSCNVAIGNLDIDENGKLYTTGFVNPFGTVGDGAVLRFDAVSGDPLPLDGATGSNITGPTNALRRPIGVALHDYEISKDSSSDDDSSDDDGESKRRYHGYYYGGAACAFAIVAVVGLKKRRGRREQPAAAVTETAPTDGEAGTLA